MASKHSLIEYEIELRRNTSKQQLNTEPSGAETARSSGLKPKRLNLSPLMRPSSANGKGGLNKSSSTPHPWDIPSKVHKAKAFASASTQQLNNAISRLDSTDSRPTSPNPFPPYADHIDRKLRKTSQMIDEDEDEVPKKRPLISVQAQDSFYRANRSLIKDIERLRQNINQPLQHERSWDSRFVYDGALSKKIRVQSASIHRKHDKFVKTMSQFRHPSMQNADGSNRSMIQSSSAPVISIAISRPGSPSASRPSSPDRLGTPQKDKTDNILFWDDSGQCRPSSPQLTATTNPHNNLSSPAKEFTEEEVREMLEAESVWDSICSELQTLGNNIIYTDLFEISILRQPHATVIALVGFVGILMGLKPIWKTVKGILLKEFSIFLNFVREVYQELTNDYFYIYCLRDF